VETVGGTSTLVSQFAGVRDYSATTFGLYSTVSGMNTRLTNVENLSGSSAIVVTVGVAQISGNDHQTRLLNLETVAGTSTLVSQFKAIRDYTTTTFSFYNTVSGINTRLSNAETLTSGTTLTNTLISLRDYSSGTILYTTISGINARLGNVETLAGTTTLCTTVIALRDVTGSSNLVTQFTSVRDYTITTGGLYNYIANVNSRLSNTETLSGSTNLVNTVLSQGNSISGILNRPVVHFYASIPTSGSNDNAANTIVTAVYTVVITNLGSGYNAGTGIFTVPSGAAGVYAFSAGFRFSNRGLGNAYIMTSNANSKYSASPALCSSSHRDVAVSVLCIMGSLMLLQLCA
jgi:hypothetical protein